MNYESFLAEYKTFYDTYHEKIQLACDCINSNPCSILDNEITNIKNVILKPLYSLDWDDSVKDVFVSNLDNCSADLDLLSESIQTSFRPSEGLYRQINNDLEKLNTNILNLERAIKAEPIKSNYKEEVQDANGAVTSVTYPGYQTAYNDWQAECSNYNSLCLQLKESITNKLKSLELIDGEAVNISGQMNYLLTGLASSSSNFTTYNFQGSDYLILDIPGGYDSVFNELGSQAPNKCYHWAIDYATDIIEKTGATVSTTSEFSTSDPNEVLQIAASELLQGRPVYVQVTGTHVSGDTYTRHFVTIAGIKEDADLNNLQQSDFLIMEPTAAMLKEMDTDMANYRTRSLFSAQNATYRAVSSNQYLVGVFTTPDEYLSETCHTTSI